MAGLSWLGLTPAWPERGKLRSDWLVPCVLEGSGTIPGLLAGAAKRLGTLGQNGSPQLVERRIALGLKRGNHRRHVGSSAQRRTGDPCGVKLPEPCRA
jgi:hypothetical protein